LACHNSWFTVCGRHISTSLASDDTNNHRLNSLHVSAVFSTHCYRCMRFFVAYVTFNSWLCFILSIVACKQCPQIALTSTIAIEACCLRIGYAVSSICIGERYLPLYRLHRVYSHPSSRPASERMRVRERTVLRPSESADSVEYSLVTHYKLSLPQMCTRAISIFAASSHFAEFISRMSFAGMFPILQPERSGNAALMISLSFLMQRSHIRHSSCGLSVTMHGLWGGFFVFSQ